MTKANIKGEILTEVTFFILLALYKPKHGYAIMQFIEEQSQADYKYLLDFD